MDDGDPRGAKVKGVAVGVLVTAAYIGLIFIATGGTEAAFAFTR